MLGEGGNSLRHSLKLDLNGQQLGDSIWRGDLALSRLPRPLGAHNWWLDIARCEAVLSRGNRSPEA